MTYTYPYKFETIYSFDVQFLYPDNRGRTITLGRRTWEECEFLCRVFNLGEPIYTKRPRKPNANWAYRNNESYVDVCVVKVFLDFNNNIIGK